MDTRMTKRRNFSDQFKAAVALEALRGDKTVQEIAAKGRGDFVEKPSKIVLNHKLDLNHTKNLPSMAARMTPCYKPLNFFAYVARPI
jgi:tartrate dehydratase alpha subunit/fumarate hydratase class I-like protein